MPEGRAIRKLANVGWLRRSGLLFNLLLRLRAQMLIASVFLAERP